MLALRRTVRLSLPPLPPAGGDGSDESILAIPRHNPHAGWPPAQTSWGVGAYVEVDLDIVGEPDPRTGYLLNITILDALVRERALPWLARRFADQYLHGQPIDPAAAAAEVARRISAAFPHGTGRTSPTEDGGATPHTSLGAVALRFAPTVQHRYDFAMPDRIELRQRFEFSASHRLHCPEFDAATNRAIFGKCNNPNGHGHNYRLEVGAAVPLERKAGVPPFTVGTLDRLVDETVLRRLDHTHLNLDVPEFADCNPSVEHIAKVCHDLLAPVLAAHGATLTTVTVWETEKTSCTYPAPRRPTA